MLHRLRLTSVPCLATRLLPLAALMAGPLQSHAQPTIVQQETQRRVSLAQEAESLAAEGDTALAAGKTAEAVNRYSAALDRIPQSAASLAPARQSVVEKFADASVSLARELGEKGELDRARAALQAVLDERAAPGYPPAKELLEKLDDPDLYNPAQRPGHYAQTQKVATLFTLAQGMVDIADYKAARQAYNQILAVDSTNTAARRGMERVEKLINNHLRAERDYTRAKMINEVDRQWETTVPTGPRTPGTSLPSGAELTGGDVDSTARLKMATLIIDRVAMADSPLPEALAYLAKKSQEVDTAETDPNLKGVNIIFNSAGKPASDFKTVTLDLRSSSLGDVLRSLTGLTQTRLSIEGNTITVSPIGAGNRIVTRIYRVAPGFLTKAGSATVDAGSTDPFAAGDAKVDSGLKISRMSAKEWLIQNGIPFPDGTSADYSAGSNQLIVRNTEENLDLVQTAVDSTTDKTQRQVMVKVVLLKAEQRRLQELGYDWLMDQASLLGKGVYAGGGTFGNAVTRGSGNGANYGLLQPNTGTTAVPIGNQPVTASLRGAFELQTLPTIDDLIRDGSASAGLTASRSPAILSAAGVFTSPQFQGILRGLDQKSGLDLSIAQTLILKAGQRATASSTRTVRFPTEFDPPQIPQTITGGPVFRDPTDGLLFQLPDTSTPPVTPTTPQSFEDKDTGSSVEVEATVGDDGVTVDLNLAVVFREFDGFINFGTPITANGQILTPNNIFQPVFSDINATAQVQVYDGATVTIGGISDGKYETIEDKIPLLGDLPIVGRFFRSDVTKVTRKAAIYFVTVKVVDPGGLGVQESAAASEQQIAAPPGP
ncbi:MAG: type and secretion system protein [Verrucomicrobiales bacterium]|nr:type and secretion system protein [Verrucomicrobiales bacterium]